MKRFLGIIAAHIVFLFLGAVAVRAWAGCGAGDLESWTLDNTTAATCGSDGSALTAYGNAVTYGTSPTPPSPNVKWPGNFKKMELASNW